MGKLWASAFKAGVFAFALVFTLIYGVSARARMSILSIIFVSHVLLFLVSYYIGKRVVVRFSLSSVVIPLFLGNLASSIILYYYFVIPNILPYSSEPYYLFRHFLLTVVDFLDIFFISFTAITIGILRSG